MSLTPENLRLVLGLKVKSLRQRRGLSLTELARASGLSVSYLSEIESGRKFPKPEKVIRLANALDTRYQELVSPELSGELDALDALFESGFLRKFPFDLFGLEAGDLLGLVSDDPVKAAAFVQTFLEVGQSYDVQVEQFLFAALRSYQRLHSNYFPELEEAAAEYRRSRGWTVGQSLEEPLREVLENEHGYVIEEDGLANEAELASLRSVYLDGDPPRLLLHPGLTASQRAFLYGREIGFHELGLGERANTSTWVRVESFEQILANFKASYFAGALLLDGDALTAALERFWARERWDPQAYLDLMDEFHATPEMFAYRLTELLPGRFGMDKLYFMRFHHPLGSETFELNKMLNLTGISVPRGVGIAEHYCRRWVTIRLLQDLDRASRDGCAETEAPLVRGERAHFVQEDAEFFVISVSHPLRLHGEGTSCMTLGFLMDEEFKSRVGFWKDPAIESWDVGLTCERCPIEGCEVRQAAPILLEHERSQERRLAALERLRTSSGAGTAASR